MRVHFALVIALLVAGCLTGPAQTPTTPNQSTISNVTSSPVPDTTSKTPDVNGSAVWSRISVECNVTQSRPLTTIQEIESANSISEPFPRRYRVFGIERAHRWSEVGGSGSRGSVSVSYTPNASPTAIERVLAHEYGHSIQPVDANERLDRHGLRGGTTDSSIVRDSIREGIAVYVADTYAATYLDGPTQLEIYESRWETWSPGTRLVWAPYYFGGRYVHRTLNSCANIDAVYESPPTTSEQLLHPQAGSEQPMPLNVTMVGTNASLTGQDRMGELFLRIVLGGEVPEARAAKAAAGWGNDRFITLRTPEGEQAFVWILRWDSSADATQFESVFADYRANSSRAYRHTRIDDLTIGVCAGNAPTCEKLSYHSNQTGVTIST